MYFKGEDIERRCLPTAELRIGGTETVPQITGYAAVFNTWADIGGWFRESIKPGAFAKTIKEADIRALMNHDENYVLGRNKSGTLRLKEDSKGLAVEIDPVPATWADDLILSMRRGDMNQMSFGFQVNKAENNFEKEERILVDVTLFDVSVVTFPAYPTTSAQVRSLFADHRAAGDISLNSVGKSNAATLVKSGKVDKTSSWAFSAEDGNKILGDPPKWGEYSKWFMGIESGADKETKQAYHYPFGKDGKVYRSGLIAIRQRAGQQGVTGIFNAAGDLIKEIDGNSNSLKDWETFDNITAKIKTGEPLTEEEIRALTVYVPNLSPPAASHAETAPPPAASHAGADTRKRDKWTEFEVKFGIFAE